MASSNMHSMNACLSCRKVKMKCCPGSPATPKCERCARKSLDCVFREHRRGRKVGTRISKSRRDSRIQANSSPLDHPSVDSAVVETEQESHDLQPSGLLNHEAMKGKFSLRSILSASDESNECSGDGSDPTDDPIDLGLVNGPVARSLFDSFIAVLNPYICQLDPTLHTFSHVRQKSAFLLSSILAMSAKAFNPVLYNKLYEHAQDLFAKVFRHGLKSTETVQAILILTYWKEPGDTRVWTSLGYVIRMCMDMGWHKLAFQASQHRNIEDELVGRDRRNIERTWYVLFVYDRSMSLQTGRPWMIECDDFIESIEDWCNEPIAIANDCLLGAFVTLRVVASAAFTLLVPRPQRRGRMSPSDIQPLITLLNDRIDRWETRWTQKLIPQDDAEEQSCHQFLIRFYGTHLRLQLYSLPLQEILGSGKADATTHLETIWLAYTSAMSMLKLISQYSAQLYFAQDSIHVMTAYSAAFLVKILFSAPGIISNQVKSNTIQVIQAAAGVFSDQTGYLSSSCALQAKFLEKVMSKLLESRQMDGIDFPIDNSAVLGDPVTGLETSSEPGTVVAQFDPAAYELPLQLQGNLDFPFEGDEAWADLFASVGFNTQDEIFLS
ncbi:fungal specific transcription factor domain-containing [Fusarium albosuccineum]|uniref:Fungal specific transcription factor domain-containing n=1 Tax=Fusarium albosuccineum TaxID=1237068 RepID=A0A8H4PKB2_9HYPO|nr:fungal specific transcription factor domain-containing [Fusarium albosuccineum]